MPNIEKSESLFRREPSVALAVIVIAVAGLIVDITNADGEGGNFYADIMRLDKVATEIHQNYVEEINSSKLIDKAIDGMLDALDPHSSYFETKEYQELMIHTEGKFGGLGIQISKRDDYIVVMTPIAGTPAERAGIQSGDVIIKINGQSTKGMSLDEAVSKLRGEPETEVTITIRREGEFKDLDYTIVRKIIHIPAVPFYGYLNDSIGYIKLNTFSQEAGRELERVIKELGKKNLRGLVFDLRFNPGGLLPQAIEVAEKFLTKKALVVQTRGRVRGQNKEFYAQGSPALLEDVALAVLVNRASASASEIVSGAIQDWDRGIIVGDTTFGKGSVQSILPLDKTHHLKLTTAFYYTPSGRCINKPENGTGSKSKKDNTAADEENALDSLEGNIPSDDKAWKKKDKTEGKDTTTYRTKSGRIVYGSGGIIPDTVVIPDRMSAVVRTLLFKNAFFRFANHEYPKLKKRNIKITKDFTIDDSIMTSFRHFLDSVDISFVTYPQTIFNEFKLKTKLEKDTVSASNLSESQTDALSWTAEEIASLKSAAKKIDELLKKESERAFMRSEKDIKKLLKEAFLVREYGQDNEIVYRERLAGDKQLEVAVALLQNKAKYKKMLQPTVTITATSGK